MDQTTDAARLEQLGQFLRTRRERLTPEALGFPNDGRRRTPGLRRSEVAMLAGVSVDWYTWLEQGRNIQVSAQVLDSIARALQLDGSERRHLYLLAMRQLPADVLQTERTEISETLQHVLDRLEYSPAIVTDARWNVVGWNLSACAVVGGNGGQKMALQFETARLLLRFFELSDAEMVQQLAGYEEVASTTLAIPYPYPDGAAEQWIEKVRQSSEKGDSYAFAMIKKEDGSLIGNMSMGVSHKHKRAELAYWVGKPFWGQGYATEAARRIVQFGFEDLDLNRIFAAAMTKNPGSYKVMRKIGMKEEGIFPQHVLKWGVYEDLVFYGMVKSDYLKVRLLECRR